MVSSAFYSMWDVFVVLLTFFYKCFGEFCCVTSTQSQFNTCIWICFHDGDG